VLAVLLVAALAAALLVVGAAKQSQALNGKVLVLSTTYASESPFNEGTAAASLGLGVDVVTPEQWASMTADQFAQYDAVILGDNHCGDDPAGEDPYDPYDSAQVLEAALANLGTWVPAVTGNVFFSTSDAVYHADEGEGDNSPGAQLQITRGVAYAAGAGATGLYFTSSCYDDEAQAWLGVLNAVSPGWNANGDESDAVHVTGSAALLMGLDDASLSDYHQSVHHTIDSWASDFTVFAIATNTGGGLDSANANGGVAGATVALEGPYEAQDGTTGAPVILIRGTNTSPSHILLQDDQTHEVGQTAHLLATVTNPNLEQVVDSALPVDGITVTFTAVSGPNAGKVVQGVTDSDGNVTIEYSSAAPGADVWQASFVDPDEFTETSNQVTVTWTTPAPAPEAVVVTPRFTG
jgi:hypothetical protein